MLYIRRRVLLYTRSGSYYAGPPRRPIPRAVTVITLYTPCDLVRCITTVKNNNINNISDPPPARLFTVTTAAKRTETTGFYRRDDESFPQGP